MSIDNYNTKVPIWNPRRLFNCLLSLALLMLTSVVSAQQSSDNYTMLKNVLSNGGNHSSSANYQLVATVGQYATRKSTANGNVLYSGFYAPRSTRSPKSGACGGVTEGLVACYPFDGDANDGSGNENHGTVNGATLIEDRFGNKDSAYSFDGNEDFILVPNTSELNPATSTISVWVKLSSNAAMDIIGKDGEGFDRQYLINYVGKFQVHQAIDKGFYQLTVTGQRITK